MNSIRITGVGVGLACLFLTGSALAGSTSTTAIDVTCPAGPSFTVPSNTVTRQMNVMRDSIGDFFFDVTLGNGFEFSVAPSLTDLALTTPAGGANYNRRIHEEKERHYADIADRLFALSRAGEVRGVVLAGTRSEANAVLPHLHPYVRSDVLGTAKLNPKNVTLSGVIEAVLNLRQERERDWEAQR